MENRLHPAGPLSIYPHGSGKLPPGSTAGCRLFTETIFSAFFTVASSVFAHISSRTFVFHIKDCFLEIARAECPTGDLSRTRYSSTTASSGRTRVFILVVTPNLPSSLHVVQQSARTASQTVTARPLLTCSAYVCTAPAKTRSLEKEVTITLPKMLDSP